MKEKEIINIETEKSETLLLQHSGNHYRHLENQRNQYVGFYFTVLVGSAGLTLNIISGQSFSQNSSMFLIGVNLIIMFNLIIGSVLLAAIKKNGFALKMHEQVLIWAINKSLQEEKIELDNILGKYGSQNKTLSSKVFSSQLAMEYVIIFVSILLDILYVIVCYNLIERKELSLPMIVILIPIVLFQIIVFRKRSNGAQ